MHDWRFVLASAAGEPIAEFLHATDQTVTWRRDDPCEASLTVLGNDPVAADIEELLTDLLVYRDRRLVFRGRIGPTADTLDGTTHTVQVNAVDYRGLLERRIVWASVSYASLDQADIAWDLIDTSQALDGGDVGIYRGSGDTTGVVRDRNYEAGKRIGEALQQLGQVSNGFEWEIDASLGFNVFYPTRGSVRDFVVEYGATVQALTRNVDPGRYANAVRYAGDDTTTPVTAEADDIATRPEGRFDVALGDTEISVQQTVADHAETQLNARGSIVPSYTFQLRPGVWDGPDELWVGDTTRVVIQSGRLNVNTLDRIEELTVNVGDVEQVDLVFGESLRRRRARELRNTLRRLENLERR